jgi:ornithine cyclodeaminase/alanine dehydrogenase-like protein (mu-crystallin family)
MKMDNTAEPTGGPVNSSALDSAGVKWASGFPGNAKRLARPDSARLSVSGCGVQGRTNT